MRLVDECSTGAGGSLGHSVTGLDLALSLEQPRWVPGGVTGPSVRGWLPATLHSHPPRVLHLPAPSGCPALPRHCHSFPRWRAWAAPVFQLPFHPDLCLRVGSQGLSQTCPGTAPDSFSKPHVVPGKGRLLQVPQGARCCCLPGALRGSGQLLSSGLAGPPSACGGTEAETVLAWPAASTEGPAC